MNYFTQNRRINLLIAFLVLLNMISLGALWLGRSRQGPDKQPPPRARAEHFLKEKLDLQPSQMEQIRKLRDAHFQKNQQLEQQLREKQKSLMSLLKEDAPDSLQVNRLILAIGEAQQVRERQLFYHLHDIRQVCNAAQKQHFEEIIRELLPPPPGALPPRRGPHPPPHSPPH